MGSRCILVANELTSYRQTIAIVFRELHPRYDEEVHGAQPRNPFGDDNEAGSMRTASPRPMVDSMPGQGKHRAVSAHRKGQSSLGQSGNAGDSPTERRSMFHEDV